MAVPEELLRRIPAFGRLGAGDRARLAAIARVVHHRRGARLFDEGDPPTELVAVIEGRVKVSRLTPAGKDVILEIFGPGDLVGAVAVYEGRPYPASAVAHEDATCLHVGGEDFMALLAERPSLARGLLAALTLRVVELVNRMTEVTAGRVEARVARFFVKMVEQLGEPEDGTVWLPIALKRQDLADLTGTTIETSIRLMSRWARAGLVSTTDEGFRIHDEAALRRIACG